MTEISKSQFVAGLAESIERLKAKSKERAVLLQAAEQAKQEILAEAQKPQKKGEQIAFSFLPVELTRVSPFFPINRRDRNKPRDEVETVIKNPWGTITVRGPVLSIYDEDVMLAILSLVHKKKSNVLETTPYEICRIMNITPAGNTYSAILKSFDYLQDTSFILQTKTLRIRVRPLDKVISDKGQQKYLVEVDEVFLSLFAEGIVTSLNLTFRRGLKGDITKALYRFYRGQSGTSQNYHILTIAKAINLNIDQPLFRIRAQIKRGLQELKRQGYLSKYGIKGDVAITETGGKPAKGRLVQ